MKPSPRRSRGRPPEADSEQTRRTIVAAALECFAKSGFHGTTIAGVAREAGFTAPALYHYFADKHELYEAVASDCVERVWGTLLSEIEGLDTAAAQLEALFTASSRRSDPGIATNHFLLSMPVEASWEPRFRDLVEQRSKRQYELFALVEATAKRTGELDRFGMSPGDVAEILRMLFRGWAFDAYSEPEQRTARTEAVRRFVTALTDG